MPNGCRTTLYLQSTAFQVTDLKVTHLDITQAEVTWLKPSGPVGGYHVVICAKLKPLQCQEDILYETNLYLRQLKPNTTYEVRVRPFHHSKPQSSQADEVATSFTTLPLPRLEDFEVRPLNSTSLEVKWKAVSGATVLIQICPVPSDGKKCPIYRSGSRESVLRIDYLKPGTLYTVTATFTTTAGGHTPDMHVSRNVTTPALDDGKNAGSLPVFSGLLMMSSLLYVNKLQAQ
ncbi:collagen alpha-1(XII) chain-like [Amblyomma americanum]